MKKLLTLIVIVCLFACNSSKEKEVAKSQSQAAEKKQELVLIAPQCEANIPLCVSQIPNANQWIADNSHRLVSDTPVECCNDRVVYFKLGEINSPQDQATWLRENQDRINYELAAEVLDCRHAVDLETSDLGTPCHTTDWGLFKDLINSRDTNTNPPPTPTLFERIKYEQFVYLNCANNTFSLSVSEFQSGGNFYSFPFLRAIEKRHKIANDTQMAIYSDGAQVYIAFTFADHTTLIYDFSDTLPFHQKATKSTSPF